MGEILDKFLESLDASDEEDEEEEKTSERIDSQIGLTFHPLSSSTNSAASLFTEIIEIKPETLENLGDIFNYKNLIKKYPLKLILSEDFEFAFPGLKSVEEVGFKPVLKLLYNLFKLYHI